MTGLERLRQQLFLESANTGQESNICVGVG
jgi:hypothetical protein